MGRIFGYLNADLTPHQVRTIALTQRHGGPDAQSSTRGERWGVGNNRLAVADLDGGTQPYTELDGAIQVVFNGEIYNHHELRDKLGARGYTFDDTCDGSVIPALYLEYGADFPEHLDGMYAVAVLDLREAPTLVLANDGMGLKTVYYHHDPARQRFCFASEIPALLAFPGVDPQPWLPALDEYLTTRAIFGLQTAFAGIRVLPPATTAMVDAHGGLRLRQRPAYPDAGGPGDFGEAGELVRSVLDREIRLLLDDLPVSASISGGLDSSLITAMAAQAVRGLPTFTIAYTGDWPADEHASARAVAARYRTAHHETLVDPARIPDLLPSVVWHLGQPNADPIALSTYMLFQHIHDAGFKVTLTGDGANELFGGYERVRDAIAAAPGTGWIDPYLEALAAVPSGLRRELYTPEYRDYVDQRAGTREYLAARLRAGARDRMRALAGVELDLRLPAYHLRRLDHLSMAHAVEARLPYCQSAVVRLARGLPAAYKVSGGRVKQVLYEVGRRYVPDSILSRPKRPFTRPVVAMLRDGQPLMAFARDVLSPDALRRTGQLSPTAVRDLLRTQATRPSNRSALAVWSLMIYMLWLDQFGVAHRLASPTPPAGHGDRAAG